MEEMTLTEMMRVSIAMPILLGLSVLVLAQSLERFSVFWISRRLPAGMWARVKASLQSGDRATALSICERYSDFMSHAFARMLSMPNPTTERLVEIFQLYRQGYQMDLSRRLGLFGTAAFIAPLIGLMGTVLGIMRAFHDLAKAGAGGPGVVAAGISEALVATAAGIAVAVVSAVLYNYFTLTLRRRMSTVDLWVFELADLLAPSNE